jgi:hypothetical protein
LVLNREKSNGDYFFSAKFKTENSNFLRAGRDGQHLAAFVKTARRADPVRNIRLGALRAFAQLRQFHHAVVSAALTHPAF